MKKTAVIIPFFQKKSGLLRRAVRSVFDQVDVSNVHVIVADDGCPIPAREELKDLRPPEGFFLTVVRQPNRGPGAARNLALENIPEETEYVAFLDSDDIWYPGHLKTGIFGLTNGADFYFAPCDFEDSENPQKINQTFLTFIAPLDSTSINQEKQVRVCHKFPIARFLQFSGVIITSSVILRLKVCPSLRFREELPNGQDITFFMDFFTHSTKIAFSTQPEFKMCYGINIWFSAMRNKEKAATIALNERKMLHALKRSWQTSPAINQIIKKKICNAGHSAANLFYKLPSVPARIVFLRRILGHDRAVLFYILCAPYKAVMSKFKHTEGKK